MQSRTAYPDENRGTIRRSQTIERSGNINGAGREDATWTTAAETGFRYNHALKKAVDGVNPVPAAFGGGNANVHLSEDVVGLSIGKAF